MRAFVSDGALYSLVGLVFLRIKGGKKGMWEGGWSSVSRGVGGKFVMEVKCVIGREFFCAGCHCCIEVLITMSYVMFEVVVERLYDERDLTCEKGPGCG